MQVTTGSFNQLPTANAVETTEKFEFQKNLRRIGRLPFAAIAIVTPQFWRKLIPVDPIEGVKQERLFRQNPPIDLQIGLRNLSH